MANIVIGRYKELEHAPASIEFDHETEEFTRSMIIIDVELEGERGTTIAFPDTILRQVIKALRELI